MISPCKDCPERRAACAFRNNDCKNYNEWKESKNAAHAVRVKESDVVDYITHRKRGKRK